MEASVVLVETEQLEVDSVEPTEDYLVAVHVK
jgi:hypothetical protein